MILTTVLILLALIHFYWLFGEFGIEQALPSNEKRERLLNPIKFMMLVVVLVLFGFVWVSYHLDMDAHALWVDTIGWVLVLLFFLRDIGDFNMVGIFKKTKHTEFAKYDNLIYIPLCCIISLGFVLKILG